MKKGLRHQKQKYFSILFIRITCTVLGLILFLTVFLYSNFRNFGLELVYRSNEQILIQIADNAKTLNQYAATYAAALMTHPSVATLMYSEELAPIERFKHYEIISNSLHTTPFAHSIYTYNGRTDTYHSIGPVTTMQGGGGFF